MFKKIAIAASVFIIILMMGRLAIADDIYRKCINNAKDAPEEIYCARSYYQRLDATLSKVWQTLLKTYDNNAVDSDSEEEEIWTKKTNKTLLSALHAEQEAWEEYRKNACQFFASYEEIDGAFVPIFGTMGTRLSYPACYGRVIEQRIDILRIQLCDFADGDDDTCP